MLLDVKGEGVETILMLATDEYGVIERTVTDRIGQRGHVVRPPERTRRAVSALLPDATVVIGDWSGELPLGRDEALAGSNVRLVQQPGAGVNFIDLGAWADAGVPVSNAPGGNASSVAEWAVTAASYLNRSVGWADAEVRAGRWPQESIVRRGCRDLAECRVGVVGFGEVGRRAASLFGAYGCTVRYAARSDKRDANFERVPLDVLVAESDVLVLSVPLTDDTRGAIGRAQFDAMPDGAVLVNVARGGVVDEAALIDALRRGRLGGAALDVVETEPLPDGSPLREFDNVLLSPHVAGGSSTAMRAIADMVARNVERVLSDHDPLWVVNGVAGQQPTSLSSR